MVDAVKSGLQGVGSRDVPPSEWQRPQRVAGKEFHYMHPKPKDKDMFLIVSRVCSTSFLPDPGYSVSLSSSLVFFFLDISSKCRDFCSCILERVADNESSTLLKRNYWKLIKFTKPWSGK